jgi:hypothetical protein
MAANPERGEVDMVVGEKTYTLRPTMNAICVMQKRTGQNYGEILASIDVMDISALRELVFTFLQPYHGKEINSLDKAGDLMDLLGGHKPTIDVVAEVMTVNAKRSKSHGGGPADPPTAQGGTGDVSGVTPVASI